jgi:hypothetical protein
LHEKLRVTGKRIDHFERALRREEIPLLNDDYDAQLAQESRVYEQKRQQKLALAAARHKESLNLKKRLQRILPDYQDYRSTIKQDRFEEFETRRKEAQNALEAEKARKLTSYRKYQEEEKRKHEEREREEELERERQRQEEEEEMEREEAARKAEAEKTRTREEERRYFPIALGAKVQMTDCVVGNKTKLWRSKGNVNRKRKKKSRVSGKKQPSVRLPRLDSDHPRTPGAHLYVEPRVEPQVINEIVIRTPVLILVGTTMGLQIDRLPEIEFLRDLTQPTVHRRPVAVKLLRLLLVGGMYLRQPDEQLNSLEGVLLDFWHQQKAELMNFVRELFLCEPYPNLPLGIYDLGRRTISVGGRALALKTRLCDCFLYVVRHIKIPPLPIFQSSTVKSVLEHCLPLGLN